VLDDRGTEPGLRFRSRRQETIEGGTRLGTVAGGDTRRTPRRRHLGRNAGTAHWKRRGMSEDSDIIRSAAERRRIALGRGNECIARPASESGQKCRAARRRQSRRPLHRSYISARFRAMRGAVGARCGHPRKRGPPRILARPTKRCVLNAPTVESHSGMISGDAANWLLRVRQASERRAHFSEMRAAA
jgi:hypothetical protein